MLGLPVLGALAWGGITSFIFPNNPTLRFFITAGLSFLWGFYAMHVVKDIYGKGGSFILHMAQRLYGIDPQLMQRDVTRVMARALQQITDDEENHGK